MVIDIKQYLKETNSVLLTEQAYKYLTEKASAIEKLEEIRTDTAVIEELEKIMTEIGNIEQTKTYIGNIVFKNPQEIKDEVMELLDKHISELKGE